MGPIGLWVHGYQLGLWVLVWLCRGYQRGCVVVHGFQHGSICLISIKFCCGLISDLVRLFCFVLFFVFLFVFFFLYFFAMVGGCRLRTRRRRLLGAGFFFLSCCCDLWLWLVGRRWRWLLLCWFLWRLFIIILMSYLYDFK